jgi:outer membrane protein assembly factor BamE (lipoprotein component of BamABCDE complex)
MMRKVFFVIMAVILTVLIVLMTRSELYFLPYPDIDTIYTREFTYDKFAMVQSGMSKDQVRQLLGSPFMPFSHDDRTECWGYSQDGRLGQVADFAWIFVRVCFKDDKVLGAYKSVIGN